jgi:hypothetical protein
MIDAGCLRFTYIVMWVQYPSSESSEPSHRSAAQMWHSIFTPLMTSRPSFLGQNEQIPRVRCRRRWVSFFVTCLRQFDRMQLIFGRTIEQSLPYSLGHCLQQNVTSMVFRFDAQSLILSLSIECKCRCACLLAGR